jgi:UDP-N-acetylglucosamine 2-epimerase (non-hydrolysing)
LSISLSDIDRLGWIDQSTSTKPAKKSAAKVMLIFGTRPEAIKMAPVIRALNTAARGIRTVNVASTQHTDLLHPLIRLFDIRIDHDLLAMQPNQTLNQLCSRVLSSLDPILSREQPDLILVQGDTTTALAGALAGFHHGIPVAHIEAGLRSYDLECPYPEEMNRQVITKLASYHFAPTKGNRDTLLAEGVAAERVFVTGNPGVDSLKAILKLAPVSPAVETLLRMTAGQKRIVLTAHRRESLGAPMSDNLRVIRSFVENHADVALIFPVHLNPAVADSARTILSGHPRIHLIQPLTYDNFIMLLTNAWLIVSDSGGLQEEAPTLGKPLLVLRQNTERPEAVECGSARLVGGQPERLAEMLDEAYRDGTWVNNVAAIENPFGAGDSGKRIADSICELLRRTARNVMVS